MASDDDVRAPEKAAFAERAAYNNAVAQLDWAKGEQVRLIIVYARKTWPSDAEGEEGERGDTVHALCDALESLRTAASELGARPS